MRSLFLKTLLWFLATCAIAITGSIITTELTFTAFEERQSPVGMALRMQAEDAKDAYERGGKPALAAVLARYHHRTQGPVLLLDAQGHDLLTGTLHPEIAKEFRQRPRPRFFIPWMLNRPPLILFADSTRHYWLYLGRTRSGPAFWFFQPQHWWIIAIVVLLCYLFAYHLTAPVKRLQKTVDRFGRGDLDARAEEKRKDELGQLARTFNQMAERIQILLAAERRLLLDISHELRSPLARLGVAVELARSGENEPAMLDRIQKEADRLNELVTELLQVTRAESDPGRQHVEPFRLDQLVTDVVENSVIEAQTKNCELRLGTVDAATISGDEELIRRALDNVIRNAIRYAPPASPIDVYIKRSGDVAQISVRDYGPGVPEESLARIFDAFYRVETDRARGSGGVGLGLAIAARAIQLHKGKLHAYNAQPGLCVEIDLPVLAGDEKPAGSSEPVLRA